MPLTENKYKNPDADPRGPYCFTDVTALGLRPALRYDWHGCLPPEGRSWRFNESRALELEADGRIGFLRNGRPLLKRFLSERSEQVTEPRSVGTPRLELIVREAMKAIAYEIAKNPRCLRDVEWRDLERVMREVFEQLGFATKLTRSGKDGGFDLQLETIEHGETQVFLVEVKHWLASGKKPGAGTLAALIDVVARATGRPKGLILSSSGFTGNVLNGRTEVEQHTVRIAGQPKIVSLCQSYLESVDGIWSPTSDLSHMLLEGTI